jgi:NarL family two-component system response regulator LiaR
MSVGVLICDDNKSMRDVLRDVVGLRPSLRVVGLAVDGNEAITQATRLQPDVILLDLAMPHRTGLGALPELVQAAPQAKIIVFSSLAKASVGNAVMELGASLYLEKGASPDQINDAIETVATPRGATRASPLPLASGVEETSPDREELEMPGPDAQATASRTAGTRTVS